MKQQIIRYLAAMNATAFDSVIHTIRLTLAGGGAAAFSGHAEWVTTDGWEKALVFLITNFFLAVVSYIDAHPIATSFQLSDGTGHTEFFPKVTPISQPLSPATTPEQNQTKTP
jgi:hypothetical protein